MIAHEIRDTKKKYGPETKLGKRRTRFEAPPEVEVDLAESFIEREPVTVLLSRKGWIRAMKGHVADLSGATFKGDDGLQTSFFTETTSKILVLAGDGKAYTIDVAKLPGGRSLGEPLRLMADIGEAASIVAVWPYAAGEKTLIAVERRPRLRRAAGRSDLVDPQGPRGARRRGAGGRGSRRPGERRPCRRHRREPQAAGVSARPDPGNGARQGRATATLPRRRSCPTRGCLR